MKADGVNHCCSLFHSNNIDTKIILRSCLPQQTSFDSCHILDVVTYKPPSSGIALHVFAWNFTLLKNM